MSRVLVVVDGEVTMRAGHSLAAHPGIASVSVLAPASSTHFPTAEDPGDFDVIVGTDQAATVGHDAGIKVATTGRSSPADGLTGATVTGLALALAVGMEDPTTIAVATPGQPSGSHRVVFPSPIDARKAAEEDVDGHEVLVAEGPGPLGAAMVTGGTRHRVVVDDYSFLTGVVLAAAAAVVLEDGAAGAAPVWSRADLYLRSAVEMGLVVGERRAA